MKSEYCIHTLNVCNKQFNSLCSMIMTYCVHYFEAWTKFLHGRFEKFKVWDLILVHKYFYNNGENTLVDILEKTMLLHHYYDW